MRYFKIKTGYGRNDIVQIDETELELALDIFTTEGKGVFKKGPVRGKDIIGIVEDWHREFGWNVGYEMGPDDWRQVARQGKHYTGIIGAYKEKIKLLYQINRPDLIGKNVDVNQYLSMPGMPDDMRESLLLLSETKKIS